MDRTTDDSLNKLRDEAGLAWDLDDRKWEAGERRESKKERSADGTAMEWIVTTTLEGKHMVPIRV